MNNIAMKNFRENIAFRVYSKDFIQLFLVGVMCVEEKARKSTSHISSNTILKEIHQESVKTYKV